jgi:glutathione S-transferase
MSAGHESGSPIRENRTLLPAPLPPDEARGTLAESGAIIEYILAKYGAGKLAVTPDEPEFADYLHGFHFANGTLQLAMSRCFYLRRLNLPPENPVLVAAEGRLERAFRYVEERLIDVPFFAGQVFTAADIMMGFSLTTMRSFVPVALAPYPAILAYLRRIGSREGYRRSMEKGDPGFPPMLT